MPSKFSRYWKSIDTAPEGFTRKQMQVVKEMVRRGFHSGMHIEAKRSGRIDLLDRVADAESKLDAVRESLRDCNYTDCGCCNAVKQALGDGECPGEPDCSCGLSALRAPQGEDK